MPGERGHYKGALRGPPTPQLGGPRRVHPSHCNRRQKSVPQSTPEVPLHFSHRAPGTRRRRWRPEARVPRSESRGGPGSARSQGELVPLCVHQGLPTPEQRGPQKALITPPCQPRNLKHSGLHTSHNPSDSHGSGC